MVGEWAKWAVGLGWVELVWLAGISPHLMLILRLFVLSRRVPARNVCANAFSTIACQDSPDPPEINVTASVCIDIRVCVCVCIRLLDNPINMHTKTQLDNNN